MIRSRRALSIPLLFALAACSSSDGGGDRTAGLEGEDVPISPTPEPVYTVGALDGEPWETFGNVSHVAFDRDGALYALDRDAGHVVVFDPAGTYVRTISQAGEGPGELGNPIGLVLLADGRVVVFDFAKQGLQVFSSDGEFLESVAFDPQDGMPGARLWALPDASVVTVGGIRIRMGPDGLA
ncbi:MAG: 6-bladed beta-propeller, partial [Gemmatimonadetes bacterium]|nr:6-bladed beta-propeller [Gemmatimonadota bacterium]